MVAAVLIAAGCSRPQSRDKSISNEPQPLPPGALADAALIDHRHYHNAWVAQIDAIWIQADWDFQYTEDGEFHRDSGTAYLAARPGDNCLYISYHKGPQQLGHIGCNKQYFWAADGNLKEAVISPIADRSAESDILKGLIYPQDLLAFLGLTPIPDEAEFSRESSTNAMPYNSYEVFPTPTTFGFRWRFPVNERDVEMIDLKALQGAPIGSARLIKYENYLLPNGSRVRLPSRVILRTSTDDLRMEFVIIRVSDAMPKGKILESFFDPDTLLRAYKRREISPID